MLTPRWARHPGPPENLLRVGVVDLSFFSNVQPTLLALQQLLGLSDVELKERSSSATRRCSYSFEENIRPTCRRWRRSSN